MPTNIVAVVTDVGRLRLMQALDPSLGAQVFVTEFRVGEGGWVQTSGGRVPRDPTDPALLAQQAELLKRLVRAKARLAPET